MARTKKWGDLIERKEALLAEVAALGSWRRGTVTEQYLEVTTKDGRKKRRGPYPLYTCKTAGQQAVSRRLTDPKEVARYREQIQRFRRFQEIQKELVTLGERLCEADATGDAQKKRPKSR